ncbi:MULTISPECIES: hypothetical protein [Halolamina]|uniref:Uncharacterized protein n=1 Tax=Halolamina pelagica TaxID=699431 RepID=A0A1I5VN90_9EURY|nr:MULTISPECIES: hypothetical protein [Halolamina]NHX37847.1 hypothetical protein [Halolamina sp. R1-12]SFQ08959.1 hypothetical protein SAMN05216277_1195 [Halolamina pelagica]
MSSTPEYVAACQSQCEFAVSTRGGDVDRHSVETVAEAHGDHCGPIQLKRIDEPPAEGELAAEEGETVATFGGGA